MNTIAQIWNTIVTSNFFNFVVMVLILAWIIKKFDLINKLENSKSKIKEVIKNSEQEKINAQNEFLETQKSVENLENEITASLQEAQKRADSIADSIKTQTENKVKKIKDNIIRVIQAEEKTISAKLSQKTAKASSEIAKAHIKSILQSHPELHEKYINQSIEELG